MVRIKHRYLLVNILYPDQPERVPNSSSNKDDIPWTIQFRRPTSDRLDARLLLKIIRDAIVDLFGDYGSGMVSSSLQVKYLSTATSTAILRVARAHYRLVWATLTFVTHMPKPVDQDCVLQVVRVSGTIKKSEEEAIRRARAVIVRAKQAGSEGTGSLNEFFADASKIDATRQGDRDTSMLDGIEDASDENDDNMDDEDD